MYRIRMQGIAKEIKEHHTPDDVLGLIHTTLYESKDMDQVADKVRRIMEFEE